MFNNMKKIQELSKIKILYVEDDYIIQNEVIKFMQKLEIEIVPASNGKIAIEILKNKKFEIIITDLIMPTLNGLDMIKHIKQKNPKQAFIVVSAYFDTDTISELEILNIKELLTKPFSSPSLLSAILNIHDKFLAK